MPTASETPRVAPRNSRLISSLLLLAVFCFIKIILEDPRTIRTGWQSYNDHQTELKFKSVEHTSTTTPNPISKDPISKDAIPKDAAGESNGNKQYQRSRAVVHMGIHKTGTTSIQSQSDLKMEQLKLDGYLMPWALMGHKYANDDFGNMPSCGKRKITSGENQRNFATCFFSEKKQQRKEKPCAEELLCYGSEIAKRRKNLFISTETFDHISGEEIKRLKSYLSAWDETVIIVYHRIFYRWIVSVYGQRNNRKVEKRSKFTIVDFVTATMMQGMREDHYSYFLVQRLQEEFANQTVIMNYDDKSRGNSEESFYCYALPDATNTCRAIREEESVYTNKAKPFDYEDLVYGAMQAGLIDISANTELSYDKEFRELAIAAQEHQEMIYNRTKKKLKRICPERGVLDSIWKFTLMSQKSLFPQDFVVNASVTEANMKSDFEEVARTTLCTLDIDSTLNETTWQDFFKSLRSSL